MLPAAVPVVLAGVILIVLGLVPDLLSGLIDGVQRLSEEFHRELGVPAPAGGRTGEDRFARGWLAVAGVVLVTLGLLVAIIN